MSIYFQHPITHYSINPLLLHASRFFMEDEPKSKNQLVWGRNLNVEMPILDREFKLPGLNGEMLRFISVSRTLRMENNGGQVFTIGQKLGEHGGTFMRTRNGGQTELLSFYLNEKTSRYLEPSTEGSILRIEGADSTCSVSGAERTRNAIFPHKNGFARVGEIAALHRSKGGRWGNLVTDHFADSEHRSERDPF